MGRDEMSHGWKLGVLKRRRAFLAKELADARCDGQQHHRATKFDQREYDALDWAIETLEPMVPPS